MPLILIVKKDNGEQKGKLMLRIDKAILDTDRVVCDNIRQLSGTDRGLLSQNILGHLRNFVEYIAIKAYSNGHKMLIQMIMTSMSPPCEIYNVVVICDSYTNSTRCFKSLCPIILLTKTDRSG